MSLRESGPPIGGLRKAMYIIEMHWHKERTRDETRRRHVRALRVECQAFLNRTKEYES
jgi:hypothetical protein